MDEETHIFPFSSLISRSASQPALGQSSNSIQEGAASWMRSVSQPPARDSGVLVGDAQYGSDILWADPATGETFIIDARTGNSYPQLAPEAPTRDDTSAQPAARSRRSLGTLGRGSATEAPAWMAEALQANEAYQLTESKIRSVAVPAEVTQRHACDHGPVHSQTSRLFNRLADGDQRSFMPWDAPQLARFSREDLRTARVLGQVDRKFVACTMQPSRYQATADTGGGGAGDGEPGMGGRVLVLVDQHAADERIRVERFFRDVCEGFLSYRGRPPSGSGFGSGETREGADGVRTRKVDPPANVLLTKVEAERIALSQDVRGAFARWGIEFARAAAVPPGPVPMRAGDRGADEAAYVQVAVMAVPEVVADKVRKRCPPGGARCRCLSMSSCSCYPETNCASL